MSLVNNKATMYPGSTVWTASITNGSAADSPAPWSVHAVIDPSGRFLSKSKWSLSVFPNGTANDAVLNLQASNSADEQSILNSGGTLTVAVKYAGITLPEVLYVRMVGC